MALAVRNLTVATTAADIDTAYPGGLLAFMAANPLAARVGALVRLPSPTPGLRSGTWSCAPGAFTAELVPHPDIIMMTGRHRKIAALVLRGTPMRHQRVVK